MTIPELLGTGNYLTYGASSQRQCSCCAENSPLPLTIVLLPYVGEHRICRRCIRTHGVDRPQWQGWTR